MENSKSKALIVCQELPIDYEKYRGWTLIGVERGCLALIKANLPIDLAIGDFDHVNADEQALIAQHAATLKSFATAKDYIDGELAIMYARDLGCCEIYLVCAGERMDMNLAAISLVNRYNVTLLNKKTFAYKLTKGKWPVGKIPNYQYFSVFSLENSTISISKMKYCVEEIKLSPLSINAMCNDFLAGEAGVIEVCAGSVIVVYSNC